jgi:hypothetical protein
MLKIMCLHKFLDQFSSRKSRDIIYIYTVVPLVFDPLASSGWWLRDIIHHHTRSNTSMARTMSEPMLLTRGACADYCSPGFWPWGRSGLMGMSIFTMTMTIIDTINCGDVDRLILMKLNLINTRLVAGFMWFHSVKRESIANECSRARIICRAQLCRGTFVKRVADSQQTNT